MVIATLNDGTRLDLDDFWAVYHQYRPLVEQIAREHIGGIYDREDRIQECLIKLWEATKGWNPAVGVSFTTYAYQAIKNRMVTINRDQHRAMRDPRVISYMTEAIPEDTFQAENVVPMGKVSNIDPHFMLVEMYQDADPKTQRELDRYLGPAPMSLPLEGYNNLKTEKQKQIDREARAIRKKERQNG